MWHIQKTCWSHRLCPCLQLVSRFHRVRIGGDMLTKIDYCWIYWGHTICKRVFFAKKILCFWKADGTDGLYTSHKQALDKCKYTPLYNYKAENRANNYQWTQHCWSLCSLNLKATRALFFVLDAVTLVLVRYLPYWLHLQQNCCTLGCCCIFTLRLFLSKSGFVLRVMSTKSNERFGWTDKKTISIFRNLMNR